MTLYTWLILALWLTLVSYWGLSAAAVKPSIGRWIWWREIAVRLGLFALLMQALQVAVIGHVLPDAPLYRLNAGKPMGLVGAVLVAFGIALAILARAHLGWKSVTRSSDDRTPGLVTSGPYALARHPMYGGMLLAMLGSAIGQSVLWLLPLAVYAPHFIRSARREEQLLSEQFPERYRSYMKQTKMLLPFVL